MGITIFIEWNQKKNYGRVYVYNCGDNLRVLIPTSSIRVMLVKFSNANKRDVVKSRK